MILTRSPYYLDIPWISPFSMDLSDKYIVQVYVWSGLKSSVPSEPTYEQENKNPLGRTGSTKVDISNFVNDALTIDLVSDTTTNIVDSNSAVWVKSQVIYYVDEVAESPQFVTTLLAVKGYGYGIDGQNTTIPANNVLSSITQSNINKGYYYLPIKVSETVATDVTIISYPNNILNKSFTLSATTDSNELIKQIIVKCSEIGSDTSVVIRKDTEVIQELIYKEELRYSPIDIKFLNKFGQLNTITFFKDKIVSLKVDSENYETNIGQPLNGIHQYEKFNTNGKSSFKINTGWIKESYNEQLKQLMLSDKVWQLDNDVFIPVNLTNQNIEYQTRQRDRLLNYEFTFDYAFSEINNI